jgi:dTDP-4-dehydrorhamnose 3,5-epimerase
MSRFRALESPMNGLFLIERQEAADMRGSFGRLFCKDDMKSFGWLKPIVQVNLSRTNSLGSVRGLHFQEPPYAEMKYVTCVAGRIFDVAVDLRQDSSTFLQWHGFELSAENKRGLLIPEGFAHGFQALTSDVEMIYFHSAPYVKESDRVLNILEPRFSVKWPLPVTGLSDRDAKAEMLTDSFKGIVL